LKEAAQSGGYSKGSEYWPGALHGAIKDIPKVVIAVVNAYARESATIVVGGSYGKCPLNLIIPCSLEAVKK
jgi:hypothetical protein